MATSWANSPARVEVAASAPFSAQQLASALALRMPTAARRVRVLAGDHAGRFVIVVGDARRAVDLDNLTGPPAARRVALATLDLLEVALRTRAPMTVGPLAIALPPTIRIDFQLPKVAPTILSAQPQRARALASVSGVVGNDGSGVSLSASFPLLGPVRAMVAAGMTTDAGANELRIIHIPLAIGTGHRWRVANVGMFVQALVVVAPHRIGVTDGADRLTHSAVRFGGGAVVGADIPIDGSMRATVAGHARTYANSKQYLVGGVPVYRTGRLALAITLGLSFGLGRSR